MTDTNDPRLPFTPATLFELLCEVFPDDNRPATFNDVVALVQRIKLRLDEVGMARSRQALYVRETLQLESILMERGVVDAERPNAPPTREEDARAIVRNWLALFWPDDDDA